MFYCNYSRDQVWVERAREASGKAVALRWDLPEVQVSQAWVLYAAELHDEAVRMVKKAIERKRDCEGAYYLLCRALFAAGRYQEILDVAEAAIEASGEDYNIYVPIVNSLGAMGREEAKRNMTQRRIAAFENHLKQVPEDARARILLGSDYAYLGTAGRRLARTQPGCYLARQRNLDSLQRCLSVLRPEKKAGGHRYPAQSLGSGVQGLGVGSPRPRPHPSS